MKTDFKNRFKEDKNMSKITDYSFLFQSVFGIKSNVGMVNPLKVSDLSNGSLRSQLKAAGIDTNSAQYKAAVKQMTQHAGSGAMFTNVQAIKNLMSQYDKDGDYIDPTTGLAGLLVTEENAVSRKTDFYPGKQP
jgi:orotidine-5'-phosphate decarboxylase